MKKPKTYKKLFEDLEALHLKYFLAEASDNPIDLMFKIRREITKQQEKIQNHWRTT